MKHLTLLACLYILAFIGVATWATNGVFLIFSIFVAVCVLFIWACLHVLEAWRDG